MILVSIIVPAYNAERTLAECLYALAQQDYPALEIIVVDDGSTDRTGEIARDFEGVTYIRQENAGPAAARNRGAAAAKGAWLAFTDSDCVAEPDWINQLMAKREPGVVGIGGTYDIANPASLLARIIHAEIIARHARLPVYVDFLGSFNVAYERAAFEAVGGFDPAFSQASGEDNDLAYRMIDAGGKLTFTRFAIVKHYHPERLLPYFKTQMRHGYWRVALYKKHPKREQGDSYAGGWEMMAYRAGAVLLVILLLTLVDSALQERMVWRNILVILGAEIFFLLCSKLGVTWAIFQTGTRTEAFLYPLFACARDVPRILGAVQGILRFTLIRKTTT